MEVQLHTFLLADLTGFSSLAERDGDDAAADLAISFADEVAQLAPEHGAEFVKSIGDAVLVHCVNPESAIELGLALPPVPLVHAGIHTGPALNRAGDWWGTTVNVTARVAAAAKAGQLLVTEAATRAAGELGRAVLHEVGALRLKNICSPVRVYTPAPALAGAGTCRGNDVRPLFTPSVQTATPSPRRSR
jgi:adenylate cyclase